MMPQARVTVAAMAFFAAALPAAAQQYPLKTVRVIVPFAPGGGSDLAARLVTQEMSRETGQPFVIDNKPGAGGLVGTEILVKAPADGYTIMISTSSWLTTAAISKPAFDPVNNVTPVIELGYNPLVLAVHPALPAKTTQEFIALARARPGELTYGQPGVGSITDFGMILFEHMAKMKLVSIPYKSGGAVMPDLLSGRVPIIMSGLVNVLQHAESGKLRILGVSTPKRIADLPKVPPIADALPGYAVTSWFGAVVPKGTPPAVVERLNVMLNKVLKNPDIVRNANQQGMTISGGSAEELQRLVRTDYERWSRLAEAARLKID
jgi:tripartite-type tricarboxylate transporter receptor subunit TctC